jgi:hypothetical protein
MVEIIMQLIIFTIVEKRDKILNFIYIFSMINKHFIIWRF